MKNQTAVQFLTVEFSGILGRIITTPMQDLLIADALKRAKEMEKQNIMNAWVKGVTSGNNMTAEKYYKETFKKD
jgi:hypothetical protein